MKVYAIIILGVGLVETMAGPIVKYSHSSAAVRYEFGDWDDNRYCYPRIPGLARFKMDNRVSDFAVRKIGVRNEMCGTNVWYQGGNHFEYHVTAVGLPEDTSYSAFQRVKYNGHGDGCVRRYQISEGFCNSFPVLRGFSLTYDAVQNPARHIDKIKVQVKRSEENDCKIEMEACLTDMNKDDLYEVWVHYAMVPNSEVVLKNGEISDSSNGWDYRADSFYVCPSSGCNSEAVLTGFDLDLTGGWPNQDMRLDEIEVGAQVYHNEYVFAFVRLNDSDNGDNFAWKVQYALIK